MRLSLWLNLLDPASRPLLEQAAATDPTDVASLARLRRSGWPAELVAAALDLIAARRKARAKFPSAGLADRLLADTQGVEQASSFAVAAHKARRFADTLGPDAAVADLCCGIGGDAMALRDAGLRVLGFDLDPVRAWMCAHNARCPTAVADVTRLRLDGRPFHIDPARRTDRGRVWRFADYQPPPAFLRDLARQAPAGAIKLSPAIDLDELRDAGLDGEVEFISDHGQLVQAVLWTGALRRHERTATRIDARGTHTLLGSPAPPPLGELRRCLFTVDAAAERAGLMHTLCAQFSLRAPHPQLGLLTADTPAASPWLTPFELIEQMPWRPRKVKAWLDDHGAGIVEVKTRGKAVDPDRVQKDLRGRGDTPYTVFVLRWDQRLVALVTRRLA